MHEKYKESEDLILEILKIIPENADIYNFYGRLKQFQGNFDKSIELLQKGEALPLQRPWMDMKNTGSW